MNTEPTTPQPKPADAAGLRFHNPDSLPSAGEPPWRFLTTEELTNALPEDAQWCRPHEGADEWRPVPTYAKPFPENTYRTKRPLPTPHAAEAGVMEIDLLADVAEWFEEQRTEQCRCHGGGETCDFCTHASNIKRARAQRATPPATQSALEAAREALGKVPSLGDLVRWRTEADILNTGKGNLAAEQARLIFEECRTALAALNAVLPPAKGGDGV